MKYIKPYNEASFPGSKENIDFICKEYGIKNYTINPDGSIDVIGNVYLVDIRPPVLLKYLEDRSLSDLVNFKFNKVTGDFSCSNNQLTSLEGCPKEVGGNFDCHDNKLISLVGCPKIVGGYFDSANNRLINLEGGPEKVGHYFDCNYNRLTSVRGFPEDFEGSLYILAINMRAPKTNNPVTEIFQLLLISENYHPPEPWQSRYAMQGDTPPHYKIAQLLNEYDVISRDGKKIYKDSLEEVFNILGKEMPDDLKFDNYEIH